MSNRVSDRHESDLGGRLAPFGNARSVDVTVEISPRTAALASVQHTAWMLINLLARFEGIVHRVGVRCPNGIQLAGRVVPLADRDADLRASLLAGGESIGIIPVEAEARFERTIVVGEAENDDRGKVHAYGNGWCGGVSNVPLRGHELGPPSSLPFGPYIAACIGAGEIFKAVRMRPGEYLAPGSVFYSSWDHRATGAPLVDRAEPLKVTINATLAGVGAVGCALMHTLWACPEVAGTIVIADNDPKGVELSNLNRYALFGRSTIGKPKATTAAEIARDASVRWEPRDEGIETLELLAPHVVSAVDRNTSRSAIQNRYPSRILSGSTLDLRAEVLRCGPPGVGACLRCFNPPEKIEPDEDLRTRLWNAPPEELAQLAAREGVTLEEATEWVSTGRCGIAGERLLRHLRHADSGQTFAVGFVSVMAGTMLAAELIKDHMSYSGPLNSTAQRALFQFQAPLARSNRASAYGRDPKCPMCDPSTPACQTWAERYERLKPERS